MELTKQAFSVAIILVNMQWSSVKAFEYLSTGKITHIKKMFGDSVHFLLSHYLILGQLDKEGMITNLDGIGTFHKEAFPDGSHVLLVKGIIHVPYKVYGTSQNYLTFRCAVGLLLYQDSFTDIDTDHGGINHLCIMEDDDSTGGSYQTSSFPGYLLDVQNKVHVVLGVMDKWILLAMSKYFGGDNSPTLPIRINKIHVQKNQKDPNEYMVSAIIVQHDKLYVFKNPSGTPEFLCSVTVCRHSDQKYTMSVMMSAICHTGFYENFHGQKHHQHQQGQFRSLTPTRRASGTYTPAQPLMPYPQLFPPAQKPRCPATKSDDEE